MKIKPFAALAAAMLLAPVMPKFAAAADTHTVSISDFDGNIIEKLSVPHGQSADISSFDTSTLTSHPDIYTELRFSEWAPYPDKITADTVIRPLYKKMNISCSGKPVKNEYYSTKNRKINFTGLNVVINVETQTAKANPDGTYTVALKKETVDITDKCVASPADTSDAFKDDKTSAEIKIYPIIMDKAIYTFRIDLFEPLGDFDTNGAVNADDSSGVLKVYSASSSGKDPHLTSLDILRCDVNRDGVINADDASLILKYYSKVSTGNPSYTWDDFFDDLTVNFKPLNS